MRRSDAVHWRRPPDLVLGHVLSYTAVFGAVVWPSLGLAITSAGFTAGQLVSAATYYWADRRWIRARLASRLGKTGYYDNGGAPDLDQSWHWLRLESRPYLAETIPYVPALTARVTRAGT